MVAKQKMTCDYSLRYELERDELEWKWESGATSAVCSQARIPSATFKKK